MTPAIILLKNNNIAHTVHEYTHDASTTAYGMEAAEKLGVTDTQVFKTLVVQLDNNALVVGIIPVSAMLSMKNIARAAGARKAVMADKHDVERSTGYVLGGVSPLGQKKRLATFVDVSAADFSSIFVSAGRRGLEIEINPQDLCQLLDASFADLQQ